MRKKGCISAKKLENQIISKIIIDEIYIEVLDDPTKGSVNV